MTKNGKAEYCPQYGYTEKCPRVEHLLSKNKRLEEKYKHYERLYELAAGRNCKCDTGPPWNRCPQCIAAHALNECGEIIREAIYDIEQDVLAELADGT